MLCTNIVLEDAVRRYPEFRGKLVTCHVSDISVGLRKRQEQVIRNGWTSYLAKQLGYTYIKEERAGIWEKVYQHASESK